MIPILTQNTDRNISARDYDGLGDDLLVTSWFPTIQGEGPYAGYPAMFVRLSGCNLGQKSDFCRFCDTAFQFDSGQRLSPQSLLDRLLGDTQYSHKQVLVITGGEPTLQGSNLLAFIVMASPYFKDIQIETNGTQPRFFDEAQASGSTHLFKAVVSPKANERLKKYPVTPMAVRWWASCYKFVLSADPESTHHTVPDWALASPKPVYVSPMAVYLRPYQGEVSSAWDSTLVDHEQTAANYQYAAQYAMKHDLLVSIQSHLFLGLA